MTAITAGAPSCEGQNWNQINWKIVRAHVYRLQMRIAEATREKRWGKVQALQHVLSRSFYAKLLAVKTVIANKGSRTPGIDGVKWNTPNQRWNAALKLKARGYRAAPLRRIYIPKKKGKRPLGIPTMFDRAMQALYALTLKPVAETTGDYHSYGFREKRSLHDAMKYSFNTLATKVAAPWVLEADIKACFDRIDHDWLLTNIPLPKGILRQWLKSGYMESSTRFETKEGTPQGGIISPILCNMALDGLEDIVKRFRNRKKRKLKVNCIRYADDFIITGRSPEFLLTEIKPDVVRFLAERGLTLSEEKTQISHINDGFDFLGFNCRKFDNKLIIRPTQDKSSLFLEKVSTFLRQSHGMPFHAMLLKLNSITRGWAYAHRHVVAKRIFSFLDNELYRKVYKWLSLEHKNKTRAWIHNRYWKRVNGRNDFATSYFSKSGERKHITMFRLGDLPIRYHIKIRSEANPYLPEFSDYFSERDLRRRQLAMRDRLFLSSNSYEKIVNWR